MNDPELSDFSNQGLPLSLGRPVRLQRGDRGGSAVLRPEITSSELEQEFADLAGAPAGDFALFTRVFERRPRAGDEVLLRAAGTHEPLIVRRQGEIVVNYDVRATEAMTVPDSKRPVYTYIPGFNIHAVPETLRRPLSNLVQSLHAPKVDVAAAWRRLPLTGFEFTILLLNTIVEREAKSQHWPPFKWPNGKRSPFVALHDVDTAGFLQRRQSDPLFRIEARHEIRSTWFVPTGILNRRPQDVEFLLESGQEVGWHGHKHDHRDHVGAFARDAVKALSNSMLGDRATVPMGMRLPKLLKSNYLFELIDRSCPSLCYDTSFLRGIVPYHLWLRGHRSRILEIPTTVPTDILLYNQLQSLPRTKRADAILKIQIARTERLIDVGGVVTIVTHPEKALSERPDFLDIYDQYLSYIRSRSDLWFATGRELFSHWSSASIPQQQRTNTTAGVGDVLNSRANTPCASL